MGRSDPTRGREPGISPQRDASLLAELCPDLAHWPHRWSIEERDVAFGAALLEILTPFLIHLRHSDLSRKTMARHRDHLWMLGGELVRRLYDEPRLRRQSPAAVVRNYLDDEGGPLIYPNITEAQQRSFDATCRKLYRFLESARNHE